MGLGDTLLTILTSYHEGYRVMRGFVPRKRTSARKQFPLATSDSVLRVTLSRLKRRGMVQNSRGTWYITKHGKEYLAKRSPWLRRYMPEKNTKRNMIIAFDIPERKRREREWLRRVLGDLGFTVLQKSVWFGPAPLPKDFIASLKRLQILGYIKFFKADEWEIA